MGSTPLKPSEPVPVWLDCDPGHDDAFAILLAAYHPGIKLLGISTVHGNAPLEKTTKNALAVLAAIGKQHDVSVYPGAAKALKRAAIHAEDIHGESGIDGTTLLPQPQTSPVTDVSAIDAAAAALKATAPGTAWVVATGGLTNAASLFMAYPELAEHIKGFSVMGGSIGEEFTPAVMGRVGDVERIGNLTQWAEFNIIIDPEAAASLFENPVLAAKSTLIPLDLTHLVLTTKEVQDQLLYGKDGEKTGEGKSKMRTMFYELIMFFASTYRDVFGIVEGPPLHDPLAVAAVLTGTQYEIPFYDYNPASVDGPKRPERFELKVVTEGTYEEAQKGAQTGRTIAKLLEPGVPGVRIPRGLDIKMFWDVIEECCQRADANDKKVLAVS